jgi:ribonuclease-3
MNLNELQEILNYHFNDQRWLEKALTHTSYAYEQALEVNNERLEFLGDAVLHLVLTEYLMQKHPLDDEGQLSALRSHSESAPFLHDIALKLDLGSYLLLGKGELVSGGRDKQNLLADALEAVIAAIYSDGGYEAAKGFILTHFTEKILLASDDALYMDSKTELQKYTKKYFSNLPIYTVEKEEGQEHEKIFTMRVEVDTLDGTQTAYGAGRNKKLAEKAAAANMLKKLG